jgi:predicted CXXCH cytochrome family protein
VKAHIKLLFGIALVASVYAGTVHAISVIGTKHDLSGKATKSGDQNACVFCHATHSSGAQLPLWGRTGTESEFTLYSSLTLDASIAQPSGISSACLSCHDGVTAFDALLGSTGATSGNNMTSVFPGSPAIIGVDLAGDHPTGVDIAADSTGIENESAITSGGLKIYNGKVECGSCHDVHGAAGHAYFLRVDPTNATLCVTCHTK